MRTSESGSLWEKVAHNLQELYSEAVGWTGEKARIGVKKMDILGIQRQIRRHMAELGGRVYDLLQRDEDVEGDVQVRALVGDIRTLEAELGAREREIETLRGAAGSSRRRVRSEAARVSRSGPDAPGA